VFVRPVVQLLFIVRCL